MQNQADTKSDDIEKAQIYVHRNFSIASHTSIITVDKPRYAQQLPE